MKRNLAIGIMSGTSLDGIDVVLISSFRKSKDELKVSSLAHHFEPYSEDFQEMARHISIENLLLESHLYGSVWAKVAADAVKKLLRKAKVKPKGISVIGAHGQTVLHSPNPRMFLEQKVATTVQLADLSRLAILTQIPVVGNFRTADIAAGGQGAPLVPHAHRMLFGNRGAVAIQNMGGIGNVTLVNRHQVLTAFDTGPGNLWIDYFVRRKSGGKWAFDSEGSIARRGRPDFRMVEKLLDHPYFHRKPPKSTGWEDFGEGYLKKFKELNHMSLEDVLSTVTHATAYSISKAYRQFLFPIQKPKEMVVCGGGGKNLFLMELISKLLPQMKVSSSEEFGVPPEQVEAISFAILAIQTMSGRPNNEPKATGAKEAVICGQIAYPKESSSFLKFG